MRSASPPCSVVVEHGDVGAGAEVDARPSPAAFKTWDSHSSGRPVDVRIGQQVEPHRARSQGRRQPRRAAGRRGGRCRRQAGVASSTRAGAPASTSGSTGRRRVAAGVRARGCDRRRRRRPSPRSTRSAARRARAPRRVRPSASAGDLVQDAHQRVTVGLEHPGLRDRLEVADAAVGDRPLLGRDAPAGVVGAELVGRPAGGDHDGEPARHRLEHRHREALAAIGVHEHVAGPVERCELVARQLVLDVVDARQRARRGTRAQLVGHRHAAVVARAAEVLDHQHDVVAAGEGQLVGRQQHVRRPCGRSCRRRRAGADAASGSSARPPLRAERLEVDAVRDHVHAVGLDARLEVHLRAM